MFTNDQESHQHSLQTLNILYGYDDFMSSIRSVLDLGSGAGLDTEWWVTRTTRDESPVPLNIECTAVDLRDRPKSFDRLSNVSYLQEDFEGQDFTHGKRYDVLWCHDAFQYVTDPLGTLRRWWAATNDGGMLSIVVPQTTTIRRNRYNIVQAAGCYHHHTIVSLIHQLAVSGWDCSSGFFTKSPTDPWLHAVVYRSDAGPLDVKSTDWYQLAERSLLPRSAVEIVNKYGYLNQQELILPWLDKSLCVFQQQ